MVKSTGVLSRRDDSDANERRLYPVHGEFIKSRGNRRLVEWSKLDLLESISWLRVERAILGKHSKTEVTQRYTVHNSRVTFSSQPFGAWGHHPWIQHVRVFYPYGMC
jgi:hypothetical protein